ncbi:putative rhamnosyl transferase [Marivita hallyeonensis]|uniref:Putative rhamnosyl transferase n=1 Tax=Marivita hallyeonensis TaxID=996342 RepID=A0A1M5Y713_9RHOB|nr:putative rhamnosyl transferase [Marivita hallyeonensis]SHI07870.1 Putative rhamnosyl transferase [Marivita hallyeonensis]
MQTIILCRFSYPAEGGFQVDHDTVSDRRTYLYDPDRMALRFALFEHFCLPGLKAQTDPDFSFVILTGTCLPDIYRQRLDALLSDMPQARVVAKEPGPHRQVCQSVLNAARKHINKPCLQVRHDDDDALAVDFVARLKKAAADCAPLLQDNRLVGFDWNRGYTLRASDVARFEIAETVTPYLGVAQAVAVQGGIKQSLMNFAHSRINRFMPTVTFTDQPMFLRAQHTGNDSRQHGKLATPEFFAPTLDHVETLNRRFALTADAVQAAFAPVASTAPRATG